jgi:DNA-binding NtrC family response regulator
MAIPTTTRIFVVDDEMVIAATLAMILKASGFDARSFTNPLEALNAADPEPPQLLITDVVMPEMQGTDLAIEMKRRCPDCKILLFSGQAATSDLLVKARAEGHEFNLLTKPVHPADLLREIRKTAQD